MAVIRLVFSVPLHHSQLTQTPSQPPGERAESAVQFLPSLCVSPAQCRRCFVSSLSVSRDGTQATGPILSLGCFPRPLTPAVCSVVESPLPQTLSHRQPLYTCTLSFHESVVYPIGSFLELGTLSRLFYFTPNI